MNIKTDTKEKFSILSLLEPALTENMAGELEQKLRSLLQNDTPHLVLNLAGVESIEEGPAQVLAGCQQQFYESDCSFVICCLTPGVEARLDELELLELLNVTPTESEAGDIVQMEEIEREILGEDEEEGPKE
jgi:anti-anti-sigma factor